MVKKSTINRRVKLFEKMYKSGKTFEQVNQMSVAEFNKTFSLEIGKRIKKDKSLTQQQKQQKIQKSLNARKRLLKQVKTNKSQVVNAYIKQQNIQNIRVKKSIKQEFDNLFILKGKQQETSKQQQDQFISQEIGKIKSKLPKRKGIYSITKVLATEKTKEGEFEREFFIRHKNDQDLEKQINILRESYNISIFAITYLGTFAYRTKINANFKQLVQTRLPN